MSRLLLSHARIFNPGGSPVFNEDGYILINGETIKQVGSDRPEQSETWDQEIDLQHRTVLPGMINAHTHLYSALATGMPPPEKAPRNFVEKLKAIWWKLDLALDEDSTAASFEAGLVAALRAGVTTVIDHHSSQNFISGSTGLLVETAQRLGVNISPAFEITDRNGRRRFDAALRENLDTYAKYHDVACVHPMIGLHASFTLSDESLAAIRKALEELDDWGIHIHVAEDQADQADAVEKGYPSVVQRLQAHGLMNDRSLFIHGLHITAEDIPILKEAGVAMVHNPTSNANNRVGILPNPVYRTLEVGLGTDGMQADMLAEAKEGILIRSSHLPGGAPNMNYAALLFEKNPLLASRLFGCKLGLISPGYRADLAMYNYRPATEISATNIYSHILFGLEKPTDVLTRGEFRIRDNRLVDCSEDEISARAQLESGRLWKKMQEL
jgi:cytosine/adenosine deaminase-related metal-dependent hydrolase